MYQDPIILWVVIVFTYKQEYKERTHKLSEIIFSETFIWYQSHLSSERRSRVASNVRLGALM